MRTIARIFAVAMAVSLLISCASAPVAPELIDTEADDMGEDLLYVESVKEIEEESEADTPELAIHWLILSLSTEGRYGVARDAVREYFWWGLELIYEGPAWCPDTNPVPIAIAFYDLNGDGVDEIVAQVSNTFFGGARSYGGLFAFLYDESNIIHSTHLAQLPHSPERLSEEGAELLGIIHAEYEWPDIYIANQSIWSPARFSTGKLPHYFPRYSVMRNYTLDLLESGEHFHIWGVRHGDDSFWSEFEYEIFDHSGEILGGERIWRAGPRIDYLNCGDILSVRVAPGTGVWWKRFYNLATGEISQPFYQSVLAGYGVVIFTHWGGGRHLLIAQDIFAPESFRQEFELDFIRAAEATPISFAQWVAERSFRIVYSTGGGVEQELVLNI